MEHAFAAVELSGRIFSKIAIPGEIARAIPDNQIGMVARLRAVDIVDTRRACVPCAGTMVMPHLHGGRIATPDTARLRRAADSVQQGLRNPHEIFVRIAARARTRI